MSWTHACRLPARPPAPQIYTVLVRTPGARVTEETSMPATVLMNFAFLLHVFAFAAGGRRAGAAGGGSGARLTAWAAGAAGREMRWPCMRACHETRLFLPAAACSDWCGVRGGEEQGGWSSNALHGPQQPAAEAPPPAALSDPCRCLRRRIYTAAERGAARKHPAGPLLPRAAAELEPPGAAAAAPDGGRRARRQPHAGQVRTRRGVQPVPGPWAIVAARPAVPTRCSPPTCCPPRLSLFFPPGRDIVVLADRPKAELDAELERTLHGSGLHWITR